MATSSGAVHYRRDISLSRTDPRGQERLSKVASLRELLASGIRPLASGISTQDGDTAENNYSASRSSTLPRNWEAGIWPIIIPFSFRCRIPAVPKLRPQKQYLVSADNEVEAMRLFVYRQTADNLRRLYALYGERHVHLLLVTRQNVSGRDRQWLFFLVRQFRFINYHVTFSKA